MLYNIWVRVKQKDKVAAYMWQHFHYSLSGIVIDDV